MNKILLSGIVLSLTATLGFAQPLNPGHFEMRKVVVSGTQIAIEMRALMAETAPHGDGLCFLGGQNTVVVDLTFSLRSPDADLASDINSVLSLPCNLGGTGYGITDAGNPVNNGTYYLSGYAAGNFTPYDVPELWTLNTWVPVCTMTVAPGVDIDAIEIVGYGDDGAVYDPNFGLVDNGGEIIDYTPAIAGVLPLDLLGFKAEKYQERSSILQWSTANEVNTSHFVVQRSKDRETWTEIGKVQAAGESAATLKYQFVDKDVYDGRQANARYYYRLNMVDRDGKSARSNIDLVQFSKDGSDVTVYVYPNPSTDKVTVELNYTLDNAAPAELLLYNELGQVVHRQEIGDKSTLEVIDFVKAGIVSGTYTLQVLDNLNGIISTDKLIVQR